MTAGFMLAVAPVYGEDVAARAALHVGSCRAYADDMSTDDKPGSASEETKRKFREALERKKQRAQDRPGHLDAEGAVHEAHGRAEHKREFRRKSG